MKVHRVTLSPPRTHTRAHTHTHTHTHTQGCRLRNTKWMYGLVVYAGHDTKLVQNSGMCVFVCLYDNI